jgi:tetratricopeptide (TPR) repeat protein
MPSALLILVLALFQHSAATAPKAKAAAAAEQPDVMARAMAELDAGHTAEAISELKDILAQNPDNFGVWFNLGVAYGTAGDDAHAVEAFRKVLALQPNLYEAQLNLGATLARQKQYAEAAKLLSSAVAQRPQEFAPRLLLGRLLLAGNQAAEAETHLRAAATINPKNADALLLLERALTQQKKYDEAATALTGYLALKPGDDKAKLELAQLLEQAKKTEEAAKLYAQSTTNAAALEHAGMLELSAGDPKAACTHLAAALALAPTPELRFTLATAYLRAGDAQKAYATGQEVIEHEPNNYDARMFLGRLLRDQHKSDGAITQFAAATRIKPASLEAWNELTGELMVVKNYPAALQTLERSHALSGETAAYYWYRALAQDALKMHKEALASYERFLSMSNGKSPEEEFKARQRARILTFELHR